jgi:hypothetical protein
MTEIRALGIAAALLLLSTPALAAQFQVNPDRSGSGGQTVWFGCKAVEVMEFDNRIHVKCSNTKGMGQDQVRYVAVDKRDKDRANRFASMGTAAVLGGKVFQVKIPVGSGGNAPGCATRDCRTPVAFGVLH